MSEMRIFVDNPATNPVNVTGSISTTPSGTQNVVITGQPIDTTPSNTSTTPLYTTAAPNPAVAKTFVFSLGNITGVAAANNFLSLFNPVGSGKSVFFGAAYISSEAVAASTNSEPMNLFRITSATGGTLQAASAIGKFQTTMADPTAEVRIGNPTVTVGAQLSNTSPPVGNQVTVPIHVVTVPAVAPPFILAPGEGIVFRALNGDTDQRWNLSIVWSETA